MTNTTNAIEAIKEAVGKLLYHGDINDAPEGTEICAGVQVNIQGCRHGRRLCIDDPETRIRTRFYPNDPLYKLIRAFCLNTIEETTSDEQKSGVWIDGEFREIVVCNDDDACPFCAEFDGAEHAMNDCKSLWIGNDPQTRKAFWLAPPAPVKEPELDEFEKWLLEPHRCGNDFVKTEAVLEKYREIKQQGAH